MQRKLAHRRCKALAVRDAVITIPVSPFSGRGFPLSPFSGRACPAFLLAAVLAVIVGCAGEPVDDVTSPPSETPPTQSPSETPPTVPAVPGVGRKGRDYGTGPVATPIAAKFLVEQRLAFLQLVTPMNAYKAVHGQFPDSHEEFMQKIVRDNGLRLPELPAGQRYVYDAEKAAKMSSYDANDPPLMVERPQ